MFRNRVRHYTAVTRVDRLREVAKHFGTANVPTSRGGATNAVANAWIAKSRSQD